MLSTQSSSLDKTPSRRAPGANDRSLSAMEDIYEETAGWHVNLGEKTIHAKRITGRYRAIKWMVASVYLLYFIGPYIRWSGRQAILFDIPDRKYYIFGVTIWPQDVWVLALGLLTFFIALFAATAVAGRVFCGYVCWQTVWTDVYTWIEERFEGHPAQRRQLDAAPWSLRKFGIKAGKHSVWIFLSAMTGITFTAYFIDVFELWGRYFALQGPIYIWTTPLPFLIGSYIGVGFMREQICFWLCPYARIQGVMVDSDTLVPAYDTARGEPRGKIKKGAPEGARRGDCVDCNLCVAVCPTGIDIREGQQEGCITCALCLDACDSVMDKVGKPKGLLRYMSLNEAGGGARKPLLKRPRVIVYSLIVMAALAGVAHKLTEITPLKLTVIHERQPLFVMLSDGSIQNSYTLKILNKTNIKTGYKVSISGLEGATLAMEDASVTIGGGKVGAFTARVRAPREKLARESSPIIFNVESEGGIKAGDSYKSAFMSPVKGG